MPLELRRVKRESVVRLSDIAASNGRLPPSWQQHTEGLSVFADIELVNDLCSQAATYVPPDQFDRWLAPRLHCALRIPRAIAIEEGFWTWLALQNIPAVEARFKKKNGKLHPWRYRGMWSRNALSRLWWGAEMTRNGPDYSAVDRCFSRTRTAQFALELMYSWDRAAAIAFVWVAEGQDRSEQLADDDLRLLSTRLKVLLPLRALVINEDDESDQFEFDPEWAAHTPSLTHLIKSNVAELVGPTTGRCSNGRIDDLIAWFGSIVAESRAEVMHE